MKQLPIFVYGTLRPGFGNYQWALRGLTYREEPAILYGYTMFLGPGYPYITQARPDIRPDATHIIGTALWVAPEDYEEVLESLDALEGFLGPENGNLNLYDRISTIVEVDGHPLEAYTYVASSRSATRLWDRAQDAILPQGDWSEVATEITVFD